MNVWRCDHPGCKSECVGTGGAIGLRAIGWWFVRGMANCCYCPRHRPDPIKCLESDQASCAPCSGEVEAQHWQDMIERELGVPPLGLTSDYAISREMDLREAWEMIRK